MDEEYRIVYQDKPAWEVIGQGISDYNEEKGGKDDNQSLCFALQAPDGVVVGGLIGATHWEWFHIDLLWLKDELRGQGYGHRILNQAEKEARNRGAKNAYLDTFSFQAPDFYQQHGYHVFGELPDFPKGQKRFYMTKEL